MLSKYHHYTKHFCFCQVVCKKILNFFVLIPLDSTKHLCYTVYEHLKRGAFMAISERIHFFRNLRGMTQKYLGCFPEFCDPDYCPTEE